MLYPRESESREIKDLSGIWKFKVDRNNEGREKGWYEEPLDDTIMMPVPASYNDITQDPTIRDHIGDVWYERTSLVPKSWEGKRIVLRVGSATHSATVWVNGEEVCQHKGGYLPFESEISSLVRWEEKNRITVVVNNVLDWDSLPPGEIRTFDDNYHPKDFKTQEYFHDFFNYAGIHRPVKLYTTPRTYIDDVKVSTDIDGGDGIIFYEVNSGNGDPETRAKLLDEEGRTVVSHKGKKGKMVVEDVHLWEPGDAYLYTLEIEAGERDEEDIYRLPVGIRTISVTDKEFLINGKPFYFKGFGKHEDFDIHGKGTNDVVNIKDFNLLKWIGANSFRTSHYPYSEEILNIADREGIVVIDESPAVGMNFFDPEKKIFVEGRIDEKTLEYHLQVMKELINRDKNHPSVVMWSVANEPATYEEGAVPYFKRLAEECRELDPTRPVTLVTCTDPDECKVSQFFDVVSFNQYYSWYDDPGHLELIEQQLEYALNRWHERFEKPVLMTEYGAGTVAGFHQDPPVMFTEEYQWELLKRYHRVFDRLDFVIGEHVWNFADFATKQEPRRVMGNRKGVFTRQRRPKAAAHLLRRRWRGKDENRSES